MYHPRLYGDFYQMGLKYGSLLRQKANFQIPEISDQKKRFGAASYAILAEFYPHAIEEIQGFAEGIQDSPEKLGAFLLSLGVFNNSAQCSVFAFRSPDSVVVGRNYDMLYAYKKFTESSLIAPTGKYAYISQSDVFIGRSDGINEKGLFVAMSFVNGTEVRPGVSFHFVIKKILENCSSTAEAAALIQSAPVSSANNFLLADKSGNLVVVESAPQASQIRYPKEDERYIYITNQFVTQPMQAFEQGGVEWSKSAERYQGLQDSLSTLNHLDLHGAKEILSAPCVCLDLKAQKFGTIWSVAANLNNLAIERAEGKPKTTNFKVETRLDWWLAKKQG